MLITTGSSDLICTFHLPSSLCFFEHKNLYGHLLHMSTDLSPFKNCYLLHQKCPVPPTKCSIPSATLPYYYLIPLLEQILLCPSFISGEVNCKLIKGRNDDLPILVFPGRQAKWLPHRGYLINSYIKFAYANP